MSSVEEYRETLSQIIGQPFFGDSLNFTLSTDCNTSQEAKILIAETRLKAKQLSILKKDIRLTMRELSAAHISQRVDVGKSFGDGVAKGLFGRKFAGGMNTAKRSAITSHKNQVLQPYQRLISAIDEILIAYDRYKLLLEQKAITLRTNVERKSNG